MFSSDQYGLQEQACRCSYMVCILLVFFFDAGPGRVSKDGFEKQMQLNHLAPALLTLLLLPSLLRGSPSRVVMVNSVVSQCSSFTEILFCPVMNHMYHLGVVY